MRVMRQGSPPLRHTVVFSAVSKSPQQVSLARWIVSVRMGSRPNRSGDCSAAGSSTARQCPRMLGLAGNSMDIVSPEKRSRMMAAIRGKNTKPEMMVRKIAHAMGFRFRLHRKDLPGSPDLVFPHLKRVIFVHGCFWHQHPGCRFAYTPKSNTQFWQHKLEGNTRRDALALSMLGALGWEVLIVWECEITDLPALTLKLNSFLAPELNRTTGTPAGRIKGARINFSR